MNTMRECYQIDPPTSRSVWTLISSARDLSCRHFLVEQRVLDKTFLEQLRLKRKFLETRKNYL